MVNIPSVLDHYDDGGLFLREVFDGKKVPEIIKSAADLSSTLTRNSEDYALTVSTEDGIAHRYPIVDAGNTLASALYFEKKSSALTPVQQKETAQALSEALKGFGFTPPEEIEKTASLELGYSGPGMETDRSLEDLFGVSKNDPMEVMKGSFDDVSPRGKRKLMMQVKEAGLMEHLSDELSDYSREETGSDLALGGDL